MTYNEKISNVCIKTISSKCIDYKGTLKTNSELEEGCVTQFQVNEDLYNITDKIKKNQEVFNLEGSCIEYPVINNEITLTDIIQTHRSKICNLENKTLDQIDITNLGLDFKDLADYYENPIVNLKTLLQALINRSCST